MVFEEVCAELEAEGYEVQPYVLPAAGVNAPHQRYRVWFVAHSYNARAHEQMRDNREWQEKDKGWQEQSQFEFRESSLNDVINSNNNGIGNGLGEVQSQNGEVSEWNNDAKPSDSDSFNDATNPNGRRQSCEEYRQEESRWASKKSLFSNWENFPTESPICNGDDGLSERLDSITFPKWRNESIKAGGNAIVPQVAHQLFKAIQNYENQLNLF
jgi:DNA (cytosine-5)-methyltransferase 1